MHLAIRGRGLTGALNLNASSYCIQVGPGTYETVNELGKNRIKGLKWAQEPAKQSRSNLSVANTAQYSTDTGLEVSTTTNLSTSKKPVGQAVFKSNS